MLAAALTEWVLVGTFIVVFVVTLVSAAWVMLAKEVTRAAVSLFVCLSGVAGMYFFMDAQFLGVVQIMVYVGGTTVLLMFGVMLTNRQPLLTSKKQVDRTLWGCVAMGLVLGPLLFTLLLRPSEGGVEAKEAKGWFLMKESAPPPSNVVNLGDLLLTNYVLPFEIASIVLLVALVGAAYVARRKVEDAEPEKL